MVRVLRDLDELPAELRFAATVGVFDGMHRGHGKVIATLTACAHELGAVPVVMTFDPHPELVVRGVAPRLLCDLAERLGRLEETGVAITIVQRFDEAFRQQTATAFLERLRRGRTMAGLVMSHESAFGHDREGTFDTVRGLAAAEGWRLVEVPTVELRGGRVSSGRIRGLIEAGRMGEARVLLGRRYSITGTVVRAANPGAAESDPGSVPVVVPSGIVLPTAGEYAVALASGTSAIVAIERATAPGAQPRILLRQPVGGNPLPDEGTVRIEFVRRRGAAGVPPAQTRRPAGERSPG